MNRVIVVVATLSIIGCAKKPSVTSEDVPFIQTTVDLLRTRANFGPNEDSAHITFSLDSVYRRHHTSAAEYQKQSSALADDPKHAGVVFDAINDSIAKK